MNTKESKKKKLIALDNTLADIKAAFKEMKVHDVPEVHLSHLDEEKVSHEKPHPKVVKKPAKPQPVQMDKKELELTRELEAIERKLSSI